VSDGPRFFVVSRPTGAGWGAYTRRREAIARVLYLRSVGVDALITEPT
jgi:hypothetical protein